MGCYQAALFSKAVQISKSEDIFANCDFENLINARFEEYLTEGKAFSKCILYTKGDLNAGTGVPNPQEKRPQSKSLIIVCEKNPILFSQTKIKKTHNRS